MKVLIADDDPVTRHALSGLLSHLGHEPLEANDGLAAWEAIQSAAAPPLAILDWMMPDPTGVEICRRLRGSPKRPYQYLIMLTARDAIEDMVEGMDAGADDYLRKPFDLRELRVRIRAGERVLALQDELLARATTDELTGLMNRRGILERLEHEVALVQRDARPLSLLVIDIDKFKTVNDSYGHPVGDEVLKEVGKRMRAQLRAYDDVGRHGGEEFAIVLPACDQRAAQIVAERVRQAISDTSVATASGAINVSVSIGTASANASRRDSVSLFAAADEALYIAKKRGRNRVEVG